MSGVEEPEEAGTVTVVGVDACPGGWVAVRLVDGRFAGASFAAELRALLDASPAVVIGVDMPLGLRADGWRAADHAARAVLGPRRASVFLVPPRPVWELADFAAANACCRALTGNGLTQQAWGLRHKLLEADALRLSRPRLLREVHPEVSFAAMAAIQDADPAEQWLAMVAAAQETGDQLAGEVLAHGLAAYRVPGHAVPGHGVPGHAVPRRGLPGEGAPVGGAAAPVSAHLPLAHAKTTWAGAARRRALLRGAGIVLPDDLGPANPVPPVDVLDAAAVAWTAHRVAIVQAGCLPASPDVQLDDRAEPIVIWY